jgi:hypothetical protein
MADINETVVTSSDSLENVSRQVQDCADSITTALWRWDDNRLTKPTGNDQFAQAMLKLYQAEENTSQTLKSIVDGLHGLGTDYHTMAVNYLTAEEQAKK